MSGRKKDKTIFSHGRPRAYGLYDPAFEKDSCGIGFLAHIKGRKSHSIIKKALLMLQRMDHRGACGSEANTGDGAGVLMGLPHEFLFKVAYKEARITLPDQGQYGAGIVFFPQDSKQREECRAVTERTVVGEGQVLLGWRKVPQDNSMIGTTAKSAEPHMEQLFIGAGKGVGSEELERKLCVIRKLVTRRVRLESDLSERDLFYFCSLSSKVIVYKGQLTSGQVPQYFSDFHDPDLKTHLAMVHSRFSTNTFPSWDRAQPMRFMCHNGEINTLRGNINWIHAREGVMKSDLFGEDLQKLFPVIEPDLSDSGTFDNALELLLQAGRLLPESVMMMIPEAWENHKSMSLEKRAFYEFHSCKQEPWDGPASIAFTDGKYIGAVLDRNGLRPSRYYVTHDDLVIMASEVGVLPVPPESVKFKGRLQPGRMFLVNFEEGRIVPDEELKQNSSRQRPYAKWLRDERIQLADLHTNQQSHGFYPETLLSRMQAFGYTSETMQFMLIPLIQVRKDPIGSMGNDAALACLSDQPRLIYDYFKQLFAQVTNPAIDSIREDIIMSLQCYIGPEGNLLGVADKDCHRLLVPHPILTNKQLAAIKHMDHRGWRAKTIDITYPKSEAEENDKEALVRALDRISAEASQAIVDGYSLIVLSDRAIGPDRIPLSILLATGAVHHHLVHRMERTRIGIVLETGEAREVHHFCLMIGFGADAINPYLGFEALWQASRDSLLSEDLSDDEIVKAYREGVANGLLKVMAKMGISTLQGYKGAQIFEAVGLDEEVVGRCFVDTSSRVKGVGFEVLAKEALRRHKLGYPSREASPNSSLPNDGQFHWRPGGERHGWNPEAIASLQLAARSGNESAYERFARAHDENTRNHCTLRGLMKFRPLASGPVPIQKVESASEIVKRFCTGAMSFGSISAEAHESLAIAMNRLGGKSNTGEGGEDPERFKRLPNGDSKRSAIKQVASGRFGVTIGYLTNSDELQIKIAQGAKPGEGGELPGVKVDEVIARIRHSTPGVGLISPPPHHDIYSIEDLKQLIHDLKNSNPSARVSVKLVSEMGVGTIAAGVAKGFADHILVSGDSGGTGASPLTSIKHAGLPWEMGIAETHQTLVLNDLRSRVVLQTDGGIKTGRDVVIAALLGAEEMGFATAPLVAMGCIMMRKCHLNTCPVGIATQHPELRKKFTGTPEHVINYLFLVAEHSRRIMAEIGFRRIDEMIGRTDCLIPDEATTHWKADRLDLTPILTPALKPRSDVEVYCTKSQDHGLSRALDNKLVELARPAVEQGKPVKIELAVQNTNRTVGTILSHTVTKKWGEQGLPDDTIHIKLQGSAGQSVASFLVRGITIELEGDANDYVGKGLSGGHLIVYPPKASTFKAEENIIIGNVALYGATGGKAFFRGRAAERFCVRNSGAQAVIEGVGDHGCEYMTGGKTLILGPTGRNFAAGMSGGIAYLWDPDDRFSENCNPGMVELEALEEAREIEEVRSLIEEHGENTGSPVAQLLLEDWKSMVSQFVKVMPIDYKRVLREREQKRGEITAEVG